jgi:transposase
VAALRYQQIDLREHHPHLIEWRRHEVACPRCGTKTRASATYVARAVLDISISLGALSAMERRASEALKASYEEALHEVEHAGVKHTDARSWLRSGNLTSLWTLATTTATVFTIFTDGCREAIRPFFGACRGLLVSDRATVFGFWAMVARQICWAHLLRKFGARAPISSGTKTRCGLSWTARVSNRRITTRARAAGLRSVAQEVFRFSKLTGASDLQSE